MDAIQISLIVLICTSVLCILALTIFGSMLLYSSKKFMDSLNKAADTVNKELEPAVKDLKETLGGVNSIVKMADKRVQVLNCALNGIVGATSVLGGKLKGVVEGAIAGFKAGINLFKK